MSMFSVLAAMGNGYGRGRMQRDDIERDEAKQKRTEERQNAQMRMQQELHAAQMGEINRERQSREGAAAAYAPMKMGQQQMADLGDPEAPGPVSYTVAGKQYGDRAGADAALAEANTPMASMGRVADFHASSGDVNKAAQVRATAKQEKLSDMQLTEAERVTKYKAMMREIGTGLAKGDWDALPGLYSRYNDGNRVSVQKDGKGGATVTNIGPDGKVNGAKPYPNLTAFYKELTEANLDPEKWVERADRKEERDQVQKNSDRDFGLRDKTATASIQNDQARLGFERQRLGMEAARFKLAKAAHAAENKLPPAVKSLYGTYDKELGVIGSAIAKAQAEGQWDLKNPATQELVARQRILTTKAGQLLAPYLGGGKAPAGATADPLGLNDPATAAAPPQADAVPPQADAVPPPQRVQEQQPFGGDIRLAQRIALIPGHAQQAQAKAYLAQLATERTQPATAGGYAAP